MLLFIHLISIKQIKTLATDGVHLDISINQPLGKKCITCYDMAGSIYYFSDRFYKNHPMVGRCSGSLSTVTNMGNRN